MYFYTSIPIMMYFRGTFYMVAKNVQDQLQLHGPGVRWQYWPRR
jgi:hypothetical protein